MNYQYHGYLLEDNTRMFYRNLLLWYDIEIHADIYTSE